MEAPATAASGRTPRQALPGWVSGVSGDLFASVANWLDDNPSWEGGLRVGGRRSSDTLRAQFPAVTQYPVFRDGAPFGGWRDGQNCSLLKRRPTRSNDARLSLAAPGQHPNRANELLLAPIDEFRMIEATSRRSGRAFGTIKGVPLPACSD
jgi:hypothetical protein